MPRNDVDVVRVVARAGRLSAKGDDDAGLSNNQSRRSVWLETALGLLTSSVLHVMLLIALALLFQALPQLQKPADIVLAAPGSGDAALDGVEFGEPETRAAEAPTNSALSPSPNELQPEIVPPTVSPAVIPTEQPEVPTEQSEFVPRVASLPPVPVPVTSNNSQNGSGEAIFQPTDQPDLSATLSGRSGALKQQLLGVAGGNEGSERAVELALTWLAKHQESDGSWRLDFQLGHCGGRCGNPGAKAPAQNAATALALLPFLGSGHTHKTGAYQEVVAEGLEFLRDNIRVDADGGHFMDEGDMYSHGLATIAICEALAMTQDRELFPIAKQAVEFIVTAQNPEQGGWRYRPREMGDTTVTGWQLMALKTASMSYVQVPPNSIRDAWSFIDSVELPSRFEYGYQSGGRYEKRKRSLAKRERHRTTSAVGLLCRMYLGWDESNRALRDGVDWLGKTGPSVGKSPSLYYDYYATQVMRHFGGDAWDEWNPKMRDFLIQTQAQQGHQQGSWFFPGQHNEAGGRLYCTSLSTLILEVYYRHLPLFKKRAVTDSFRL